MPISALAASTCQAWIGSAKPLSTTLPRSPYSTFHMGKPHHMGDGVLAYFG
jgi:hypothetical protein